jgi:hypothetical protein
VEPDFINRGVYLAEEFAEVGYYAILTARCFWRVRRQPPISTSAKIVSGLVLSRGACQIFFCVIVCLAFVPSCVVVFVQALSNFFARVCSCLVVCLVLCVLLVCECE